MRGGLCIVLVACVFALKVATPGEPAQQTQQALLASETVCPGSSSRTAPAVVQQRALLCLVNWARAHRGLRRLLSSSRLADAARRKARDVVACGRFAHDPCGRGVARHVAERGYRYAGWAENLFVGEPGVDTAFEAMRGWLGSDGHRRNMLAPALRQAGVALLRPDDSTLWVLELAAPR